MGAKEGEEVGVIAKEGVGDDGGDELVLHGGLEGVDAEFNEAMMAPDGNTAVGIDEGGSQMGGEALRGRLMAVAPNDE